MSGDDLEQLLEQARSTEPRAGAKARLRSQVLGAAVSGAALTTAAHAAATPAKWLFGGKLVTMGLCVGGGVALGALVVAPLIWQRTDAPQRAQPAVVLSGAPSPTTPAPTASWVPEPALPTLPSPIPRNVPSQEVVVPSIERETALLAEAQRALRAGNARGALSVLERYDREIGSGAMAEEAAAARAVATCSVPKTRSAAALAAFRVTFPSSPLLPRVQAACSHETSHDDFELDSPSPTTKGERR